MATRIASRLKSMARDLLPGRWQVPLKFHANRWLGKHEPEMSLLPFLIEPGDLSVDVGGNRGAYAYLLNRLCARIEVFEPNPACLKVLQGWARRHRSVMIHPVALSDHLGSTELHVPVDDTGMEHDASGSLELHGFTRSRAQAVALRTLDSYGFEDVRFLKIDVEGHEARVLRGASRLLAHSRPAILVEIEQRHLDRPIAEVFELIHAQDYSGWFLDGTLLRPLSGFDVAADQSIEAFHAGGERYINNFLFLADERVVSGEYRKLFLAKGVA